MIYLLSEKRLKADFLNDNIDSSLILPSIQTAQDIYLRQTLGDSLLDKICNMVRDNELEEPYKTLLDDYIIIYLEYLAMAELCVPSSFKIGNIGVAQAYDNNVNTQTIQNVKYLESYYKQKAGFYENRLTTFIQQHCNLYPEYHTATDVTVSSESTLQCGIFLGGTTSRKKIINNNSNNNIEVGNYVRYDKAQNLSELEKQQARENIGVSSGGSADLSNYYTKQQTDTAIQTAIESIETFSGDYNDLENKPTLSTVATSGSYNDLVNKPIVDLLSLPYYEQVNQIDFYSDIFMFVGGYIMTIEGVILNGNKCVYEIIGNSDDGMPIKQVDFYINRTTDSFIIRFYTRYNEANENIPYEFIYTDENGDMLDTLNLVTKSELEETIGNINNLLNTI